MELSREELVALDRKHYLHPTSPIKKQLIRGSSLIVKEGKGVYLYDVSGRRVLEGMSSLWNVNVGYGRRELAEVAAEAMNEIGFCSSFNTFSNIHAIRLAAKIAELAPGNLNSVFFTSGGSEANDTAFKLAWYYWRLAGKPNKRKLIKRKRSFHGVTVAAATATSLPEFNEMAAGSIAGFIEVDSTVDALRDAIEREGADSIAAFITEPIQGAGGVWLPDDDYLEKAKRLCEEHDILFIADEVITGFGRTGEMFGMKHWGVVPDMMTFAKGVSSGYMPLGGVVLSESIHRMIAERTEGVMFHGFTYSGHPVSCAVALKNIEIIEEERLVENARIRGKQLLDGLTGLQKKHPGIKEVRGLGLIAAVEFHREPDSAPVAPRIAETAFEMGLICRPLTFDGADAIAFAPPLIIDRYGVDELLSIFGQAVDKHLAGR